MLIVFRLFIWDVPVAQKTLTVEKEATVSFSHRWFKNKVFSFFWTWATACCPSVMSKWTDSYVALFCCPAPHNIHALLNSNWATLRPHSGSGSCPSIFGRLRKPGIEPPTFPSVADLLSLRHSQPLYKTMSLCIHLSCMPLCSVVLKHCLLLSASASMLQTLGHINRALL